MKLKSFFSKLRMILHLDLAICHQNCFTIFPPELLRRLTGCYVPGCANGF